MDGRGQILQPAVSCLFSDLLVCLQPPGTLTAHSMTSQRAARLSELRSGPFVFFLLFVCFRPCILMFGSILVASMCGRGKKGFQGSEFKGQAQPISFAALTLQINLRLFSFVRNQWVFCFFSRGYK